MPADKNISSTIGFLTVIEHESHGLFGGYLVLNLHGRPLEFHCTVPVKANRAQEILYGPTLTTFLYGEQIGQALIAKAKIKPVLVCTNVAPAVGVREFVKMPVVLVHEDEERSNASDTSGKGWRDFDSDGVSLSVPEVHAEEIGKIGELISSFSVDLDPREPFDRIREAIAEAQKSYKAAA